MFGSIIGTIGFPDLVSQILYSPGAIPLLAQFLINNLNLEIITAISRGLHVCVPSHTQTTVARHTAQSCAARTPCAALTA
jgi:hypothetical protein